MPVTPISITQQYYQDLHNRLIQQAARENTTPKNIALDRLQQFFQQNNQTIAQHTFVNTPNREERRILNCEEISMILLLNFVGVCFNYCERMKLGRGWDVLFDPNFYNIYYNDREAMERAINRTASQYGLNNDLEIALWSNILDLRIGALIFGYYEGDFARRAMPIFIVKAGSHALNAVFVGPNMTPQELQNFNNWLFIDAYYLNSPTIMQYEDQDIRGLVGNTNRFSIELPADIGIGLKPEGTSFSLTFNLDTASNNWIGNGGWIGN